MRSLCISEKALTAFHGPGGNGWPINGCGLEIESESDRKGGGVESDPGKGGAVYHQPTAGSPQPIINKV